MTHGRTLVGQPLASVRSRRPATSEESRRLQPQDTNGNAPAMAQSPVDRRRFLLGAGALAAAGTLGSMIRVDHAEATPRHRVLPVPAPIPGGIQVPNGPFIHWFLPGPETATTPFLSLQGMGLDTDPSTLTNFEGFTAYAVVAGEARGNDDLTYNVEFDIRAYQGTYIAANGSRQYGTFAFL